ncbi:MAG: hypothetical protein ABS888_00140 [Eubacteriales bacterium]
MKIITRTLATTAALMLVGAAGAAATEPSPADACVEAGNIWAGDFCYDREASNGYVCDGVLQYEPCTPADLPVVEPVVPAKPDQAPVEQVVQPVPAPAVYTEPAPVVPRTELAYTGSKETAAVLAVLALVAGGGLLVLARRM